ncbi:MAG: LacI family DNA-binding transcriptional regulator [Roseibium sp.]
MAKLKDIAEAVGISMGTVSRVLNNDKSISVSPSTRTKILTVAEQLDYVPPRARNPSSRQIHVTRHPQVAEVFVELGERWSSIGEDPYYSRLRKGIEDRCFDLGVDVVATKGVDKSRLREKDGPGVIVVGRGPQVYLDEKDYWQNHLVFADWQPQDPDFDSVCHDLTSATFDLLDQLADRGYQRIAFIGGKAFGAQKDRQELRHAAYLSWCQTKGDYDGPLVSVQGTTTDNGYSCMVDVLSSDPRPDAVLACTDDMAIAAYKALREADLSVPKDIAIVGFNDNPSSEMLDPPLSSVKLAPEEIGATAVDLLLERLAGRNVAKKVVLNSRMIWRKSTN